MENFNKEEEIQRLLENLPAQKMEMEATVPSMGKFYTLKDASLPITVRPMKYEDEREIADARKRGADPINILLERCVSNIDIQQLFLIDKLALLIKIREATYGEEYNIKTQCLKCHTDTRLLLNINRDLILRTLPEDMEDPREIELPLLKKSLKVRMPKLRDEEYLTGHNDIYSNLWRFVQDIDGCSHKEVIAEVIKKLPMKDLHMLLAEITCSNYGLTPLVSFTCDKCGETNELDMPITEDFFLGT